MIWEAWTFTKISRDLPKPSFAAMRGGFCLYPNVSFFFGRGIPSGTPDFYWVETRFPNSIFKRIPLNHIWKWEKVYLGLMGCPEFHITGNDKDITEWNDCIIYNMCI